MRTTIERRNEWYADFNFWLTQHGFRGEVREKKGWRETPPQPNPYEFHNMRYPINCTTTRHFRLHKSWTF
jgi:hypothetical protein